MRGAFGFQILNMPELQYAVPVMLSRGNVMQKAYENVYGKRPLADDQELQYVSYFVEDGDVYRRMHYHTWNSEQDHVRSIWNLFYQGTLICNNILDQIEKEMGIAEVRAMRAFYYS